MTGQTNQEGFEEIFEEAFAHSETTPEERFTVKHNGQEHGLTREEMVAAAQKGMDYDRVREKLEEARGQIAQIDRLAKQKGLSRGEEAKQGKAGADFAPKRGSKQDELVSTTFR